MGCAGDRFSGLLAYTDGLKHIQAWSKTFALSSVLLPTTALCFQNALTSSLRLLLLPLRSLGMSRGLLNVSRLSTLSRRFCPRTCFFAIPTTTNHSMSILMLATSSYALSLSKTIDPLLSIVASSMLCNAITLQWRKNSSPSSKPSKSFARCCLVVVHFTCGPITRI